MTVFYSFTQQYANIARTEKLKKIKGMFLLPVTQSENSNLEVWLCAEPYIWDVEGKMLDRIVHYSLMSGNNM